MNETLARQAWPGAQAVGKQVLLAVRNIGPLGRRLTTDTPQVVIGVVRDIKNTSLREAAEPSIYFTQRQFPFRTMQVVVRARHCRRECELGHSRGDPAPRARLAVARDQAARTRAADLDRSVPS